MKRLLSLIAILGATACGTESPTSPSATTLTITVARAELLTFETIQASARAVVGNSEQAVAPRWTIDDPTVAIVQPAGQVTGLKHGRALLVATYGGVSASTPLRVIANYRGTWSGTTRVVSCDYWDFRVCGRQMGQTNTPTVVIDQTAESVRAALRWSAGSTAVLSGHVAEDGALILRGQFQNTSPSGAITQGADIIGWRSRLNADGSMSGEFTAAVVSEYFPFVLVHEMSGFRKVS